MVPRADNSDVQQDQKTLIALKLCDDVLQPRLVSHSRNNTYGATAAHCGAAVRHAIQQYGSKLKGWAGLLSKKAFATEMLAADYISLHFKNALCQVEDDAAQRELLNLTGTLLERAYKMTRFFVDKLQKKFDVSCIVPLSWWQHSLKGWFACMLDPRNIIVLDSKRQVL